MENALDIIDDGFLLTHRPEYGTDQEVWPDGSRQKRSYFSARADIVWQFAPVHGEPVILRIARSAADFRRESTGDLYVTKKIALKHVEILTDDGWEPLA
jgi:hypothetical protein